MKFLASTIFILMSINALANVGAFGGFGGSIKLVSDSNIQMVSEDISIKIVPSKNPVRGDLKYLDEAHYDCHFVMRNLSNKAVDVKMGFPLSGNDNFMIRRKGDKISNHNFKAYLDDKEIVVSYEKISADKHFNHIFLWNTEFAPNEEKKLRVTYKTFGYTGLGSLQRKPYNWTRNLPRALQIFEYCTMQSYEYVTLTGNSWSGKIENAKFSIDVGAFERYLDSRGYLAGDKNKETGVEKALRNGVRYRHISPDIWNKSKDGEKFELKYSPFEPKENISIAYYFTIIPRDLNGLNFLLEDFSNLMKRENNQFTENDKKLISSVILEFYGIKTDNTQLKDFLKKQIWYPVKNPPKLDENMKSELLKYLK